MITSQSTRTYLCCFQRQKNIGIDDLGFPVTGEVIRIIPVIMGSKSWSIQTILGVLVVVGVIGMTVGCLGRRNMGAVCFQAGVGLMLVALFRCSHHSQRDYPVNRTPITKHLTLLAASRIRQHRDIQFHWVMESVVSAVQLFRRGFTLKTSNKNTSI
jgi:hypothetical protein